MCPLTYTCPENNGCTFKGTDLRPFTLSCGVDFYGGDLSSQYAQNYQKCTRACADNADCVAASFTGGKGDGDCYLKSKSNGGVINSNVNGILRPQSTIVTPANNQQLFSSTLESHLLPRPLHRASLPRVLPSRVLRPPLMFLLAARLSLRL